MKAISYKTGPFAFGRVSMLFAFQLEVAKRMVAPLVNLFFNLLFKNNFLKDSEFRSRIGLTCQNWAEPKIMFDIPGILYEILLLIL